MGKLIQVQARNKNVDIRNKLAKVMDQPLPGESGFYFSEPYMDFSGLGMVQLTKFSTSMFVVVLLSVDVVLLKLILRITYLRIVQCSFFRNKLREIK